MLRKTIVLLFLIYIGYAEDNHCSECTGDDLAYYDGTSFSVGVCGASCTNQETDAIGIYGDFCKCCSGLTRPQCVSQGDASMCGWVFHEGCGYCVDWGGAHLCGSVIFDWGDDYDHCDPDGVSDLGTCSYTDHQTNVNDDECDSHCSFEIGSCKESIDGHCAAHFVSFGDYMDEHLNLEVADETTMQEAYDNWLET
eukprot:UN13650